MELQVIMEASTETLNGTMWLGHSPSPPYQRLSPNGRHEERDVIATQQVSVGYHAADGGILWHDKRESPKNSPNVNNLHSNGSRINSPTSDERSYNQASLKRRSPEANETIGELNRKHVKRDGSIGSNGSAQWSSRQVEELAEHLAADLDGSLSVLAANDLASAVASYNMSDALLTLPSLTIFKQEAPSPENQANNSTLNHVTQRNVNGPNGNGNIGLSVEPDSNENNNNIATTTTNGRATKANNNNNGATNNGNLRNRGNENTGQSTTSLHQLLYTGNEEYQPISSSGNHVSSSQQGNEFNEDSRFQYVLAAATSIATKLNEETLTYLNQGQSYEIKLKKLGDLSAYRGKILSSSIRICFHERRFQYTEREQMLAWQMTRPGERLLEVDSPLSYGMIDLSQSSSCKNVVEIMWDPTKEVGVYIKVNCISTEFTPKKHGGEKGVPFRIQVETKLPGGSRLHAASCQIKVFKLKGGDRKHKQDRDKMLRRPPHEQDNYQPSYECTVLSDIPLESLTPPSPGSQNEGSPYTPADVISPRSVGNMGAGSPVSISAPAASILDHTVKEDNDAPLSTNVPSPPCNLPVMKFPREGNEVQTCTWLRARGFQTLERTFANFSAADMLALSRDDVIQICGVADGIRLFNALRYKPPPPELTLYFAAEGSSTSVWHAVYLDSLTSGALASKLITSFNLPNDRLHSILLQGPQGVHIMVSDELVANMKNSSMYLVETVKDSSSDRYKLLLQPFSR